MYKRVPFLNLAVYCCLVWAAGLHAGGIIDGNDSVAVWNTGQVLPMGFRSQADGMNMFRFCAGPDGIKRDLSFSSASGSLYVGHIGGKAPDPVLLMIAVEADSIPLDGFSLAVRADDLDAGGGNPETVFDSVLTGADLTGAYGYGPQDFKPVYSADSTGLPFAGGITGTGFRFLFADLGITFATGTLDYAVIHYRVSGAFNVRIALNVYGYAPDLGGIRWTNPTADYDSTSSCLISLQDVTVRDRPQFIPGFLPGIPGTRYDLYGRQVGFRADLPAGIYLETGPYGITKKVIINHHTRD